MEKVSNNGNLLSRGSMDKLLVKGGYPIHGEVEVSGAKNAALPILFATILTSQPVILHNVPRLLDIETTIELLRYLGAWVEWTEKNTLVVECRDINQYTAPYELVKKMRASILSLGPLMGRYQQASVSLPGGCAIGARPVDQHLKGMKHLGAIFELKNGYITGHTQRLKLQGGKVIMDVVSVTGTENLIMAAVLAEGVSVIENAAKEPEVVDLISFLNSLGAKIKGGGSSTLVIEGVESLSGGEYTVIPDRIEAGTYLAAGAIARGEVTVCKVDPLALEIVLQKFREMGGHITTGKDFITLNMRGQRAKAVDIITQIYPGFPTDMQAQIFAVNSVAKGTGVIEEMIFENRMMHAQELQRLGAQVSVHDNVATVTGVDKLYGATVMATDIRASASLVIAGLVAEGETVIEKIYHVDRGYTEIEKKMSALGAQIKRIEEGL